MPTLISRKPNQGRSHNPVTCAHAPVSQLTEDFLFLDQKKENRGLSFSQKQIKITKAWWQGQFRYYSLCMLQYIPMDAGVLHAHLSHKNKQKIRL